MYVSCAAPEACVGAAAGVGVGAAAGVGIGAAAGVVGAKWWMVRATTPIVTHSPGHPRPGTVQGPCIRISTFIALYRCWHISSNPFLGARTRDGDIVGVLTINGIHRAVLVGARGG